MGEEIRAALISPGYKADNFDRYKRYRDDLESLEYQTPEDAFWSRLPVEARSGVAFKLFDEVALGDER